jgi:hypothetical protein
MWRRNVPGALLAGFVPAVVASAVLIRRDLSGIRSTRRGRYVLAHMPPSAQAVRAVGLVIVWRAAYRHRLAGIALGHVVVAAGWSYGLPALLRTASQSWRRGVRGARAEARSGAAGSDASRRG